MRQSNRFDHQCLYHFCLKPGLRLRCWRLLARDTPFIGLNYLLLDFLSMQSLQTGSSPDQVHRCFSFVGGPLEAERNVWSEHVQPAALFPREAEEALRLKSFDYRAMNLLLYRMRGGFRAQLPRSRIVLAWGHGCFEGCSCLCGRPLSRDKVPIGNKEARNRKRRSVRLIWLWVKAPYPQ